MTKQELENTAAWRELGPTASLRYYSKELCNAHREQWPDKQHPEREAVVLGYSPLGLCIDFTDRRGLEHDAAYYHAPQDSLIVCRKDGRSYFPKTAVAKDGCIVLM